MTMKNLVNQALINKYTVVEYLGKDKKGNKVYSKPVTRTFTLYAEAEKAKNRMRGGKYEVKEVVCE